MTTLVLDANILVGAILGRSLPLLTGTALRGVDLTVPAPMVAETAAVVERDGRISSAEVRRRLKDLLQIVEALPSQAYHGHEEQARERLEARGQSDWPVLASAMALNAAIWTKDRDLFGVGVPVWSTRNIRFVEADEAGAINA